MVQYSMSAQNMRSSEIRKLMALAADPSIISFSGGMPANSLLPAKIVDELYNELTLEAKQVALQYGPTSGFPPLLKALKEYLKSRGLPVDNQGLIITTGAQQALNLVGKIFLDPGDVVVTEYPSFIGAVASFRSFNADLVGVPLDENGINIEELKKVLDTNKKVKLLYVNPVFQNPAGTTYSNERKQELLDLLKGRDIVLIEDDPYSELYFNEEDKPLMTPIKAMANESVPICYVGTFAKIFGPGLRLGWLLGPTEIVDKCELAKQSMDACTTTFTQVLAAEYLTKGKLPGYLSLLRPIYARRAKIMLEALDKYMPAEISWTQPRGGFFVWVTLPEHLNATDVFTKAIQGGAAIVIGSAFDPEGKKNNSFRLAFSHTPEDNIAKGIEIVANAVKSLL